jgi:4-hydroxybenzoate polyprenyltransferase
MGKGGFDYVGNDWADLPVWEVADRVTAVAAPARLVKYMSTRWAVDQLCIRATGPRVLLKALRPHQWVKNLLVFLPVIAAHKIFEPGVLVTTVLMFLAFSLYASAIYILNDISDMPADRVHPRKRFRPFAAGDVSIPRGIITAIGLLVAGALIVGIALSWIVAAVLLLYVVLTTLYSLVLKTRPIADVFALTGLYVLRIIGGAIATSTPLSSWFVGFVLFLFLSLAFIKRYTELVVINEPLAGRGYAPADAPWIQAIGTCAGYMAVVILALYINAPEVTALYSRPQALWALCPLLLFWVTRLWFRASRKLLHDDPVVEALRDPVSYVAGLIGAMVLFAAI